MSTDTFDTFREVYKPLHPEWYIHSKSPIRKSYCKNFVEAYRLSKEVLEKLQRKSISIQNIVLESILEERTSNLTLSKHAKDRMNQNLNKWSRTGKFIELYEEEKNAIENISDWFWDLRKGEYSIFEIGYNANHQIIKVGIAINLHSIPNLYSKKTLNDMYRHQGSTDRFLFLFIQTDYVIRTIYVCPIYKNRKLKCSSSSSYCSVDQYLSNQQKLKCSTGNTHQYPSCPTSTQDAWDD